MRHLLEMTVMVALLLALSFGTGNADGPAPGGSFVDDDTSPHEQSIEAIALAGITKGCNPPLNTWFCPQDSVTRGQMAAFLTRALDLPEADPSGFTDTGSSLFAGDIDRLAAAGITHGCNPPQNDRYCPDSAVTRGQMAAFLTRALHLPDSNADTFVDDDGSVFEDAIERLRLAGITLGCNPPENDRFCPDRPVSRAEMASFLIRGLELEPVVVAPRPYRIDVVGRDDWGAAPERGAFVTHDIGQITIHHAGSWDGITGPGQFQSWQRWHFYLGWPDIAYHFIIGRDGRVYEGRPYRAVGDTATEYDPTGHLLIVVEGDFDADSPTATQVELLAQMVAWGSQQFGLDVATVTGHRDHAVTTCPGDNLYALIENGSLSARAAAIIAEGGVTLYDS